MKKLIITIVILLSFSNLAFAEINYQELKQDREACYSKLNSKCFYRLTFKYSSDKRYLNIIKCDYAYALMAEKEYARAKTLLQSVLANEKENKKVIEFAKEGISKINEQQKNINQANRKDTGNYYNASSSAKWQNPKKIKIYMQTRTGKEYLIKNAFKTWAQKSGYLIEVFFVTNPNSADIKCSVVNTVSKTQAGVTNLKYVTLSNGKKYIKSAELKIGLLNPYGGKYTDKNLESIALHEAGHALGIVGYHSDNINDIMYYSTESYKNGFLSNRDINTLKAIYSN